MRVKNDGLRIGDLVDLGIPENNWEIGDFFSRDLKKKKIWGKLGIFFQMNFCLSKKKKKKILGIFDEDFGDF